jgi:hypothetical protein
MFSFKRQFCSKYNLSCSLLLFVSYRILTKQELQLESICFIINHGKEKLLDVFIGFIKGCKETHFREYV